MNGNKNTEKIDEFTCNECGASLRNERVVIYEKTICNQCRQKRNKIDKIHTTTRLILSGVGFLLGFIASVLFLQTNIWNIVIISYVCAGIPWGWNFVNLLFSGFKPYWKFEWVYFIIHLAVSVLIGIIAFPAGVGTFIKKYNDERKFEKYLQSIDTHDYLRMQDK